MGIKHDLALLNFTVLGEKTHNILFSKTRVDSSNEEVGPGVSSSVSITVSTAITTTVRRVRHVISGTTIIGALSRRCTKNISSCILIREFYYKTLTDRPTFLQGRRCDYAPVSEESHVYGVT
jgi:hypothetical protein